MSFEVFDGYVSELFLLLAKILNVSEMISVPFIKHPDGGAAAPSDVIRTRVKRHDDKNRVLYFYTLKRTLSAFQIVQAALYRVETPSRGSGRTEGPFEIANYYQK